MTCGGASELEWSFCAEFTIAASDAWDCSKGIMAVSLGPVSGCGVKGPPQDPIEGPCAPNDLVPLPALGARVLLSHSGEE